MSSDEATVLSAKLVEAVQAFHDPRTPGQAKKAAHDFILAVTDHPLVASAVLQLLTNQVAAEVRFFALRLVTVLAQRGAIDAAHVSVMRQPLVAMAGSDLSQLPAFVREKLAQALAALAVYSANWPADWQQLDQQLLEQGKQSPAHAAMALTFFRDVGEILQSDAASSRLDSQRRKALAGHLGATIGLFAQALQLFTGSLFPQCAELGRAGVLAIQELAGVVSTAKLLAANLDKFLHAKLADPALRLSVLQAFTEMLTKDIAKDLKEAPEATAQFIMAVIGFVAHCSPDGLNVETYDIHRSVAMLIRDFVECNRPSLERHAELREQTYGAAMRLLRYPSICIQSEGAALVHMVLKTLQAAQRAGAGGKAEVHQQAPAWLQLRAELMPLMYLCTMKEIPATFDFVPVPAYFKQAMQFTAEQDVEEDLPGMLTATKSKTHEIIMALLPFQGALRECVAYVHEMLSRVLPATAATAAEIALPSFDAALGVTERVLPHVTAAMGQDVVQASGEIMAMVLKVQLPGPELERRRSDYISRVGPAMEVLAGVSPDQSKQLVVQTFGHLFAQVEGSNKELRTRALYACTAVCKAAPHAIRPVLDDVVAKASGLLSASADQQHVLCESLVAASTSAQDFGRQQALLQNLLAPLMTRWGPLAEALAVPDQLVAALLAPVRTDLETAVQLLQCFSSCFQASVVPTDAAALASGGFLPAPGGDGQLRVRNPASSIAASILPGLLGMLRALPAALPSDITRPLQGSSGALPEGLRPYLTSLDLAELKSLTSRLDKSKEAEAGWESAFPAPAGVDTVWLAQGRHLLYRLRSGLYSCIGAAMNVQDGVLTLPNVVQLLESSLLGPIDFCHPFHLELQLRSVWLTNFGHSGMTCLSEAARQALAAGLLPRLLASSVQLLDRYWTWLQTGASGPHALQWGMCSATIMASRTLLELATALVLHVPLKPPQPGTAEKRPTQEAEDTGMKTSRKERKGKAATMEAEADGNSKGGGPHTAHAFAGAALKQPLLLQAVEQTLCSSLRWKDPKVIGQALIGLRALAVQIMSGGESHNALRDSMACVSEAPERCSVAVQLVLKPLIAFCAQKPQAPPADGVLQGVVGQAFADFFRPSGQEGGRPMSPWAAGMTAALWPVILGMCQVFVHVCKSQGVPEAAKSVASFPALAQSCEALAALPRIGPQEMQRCIAVFLDSNAEAKLKRSALRNVVCMAVDPPGHDAVT